MVEILLALSQDEDQSIFELCDTAIRTTLQELSFQDVVEQIFITHIIRLPRIVAVGDEEEQIAAMLLFKGLVQTLQHANLKMILAVKDTLERFVAVLISAVELKRDMSLLLEEYSLRNVDEHEGYVVVSTWKQFKNFRSETIVHHFQSVCQLIGASNASDVVVGYLLERLSENVSICNQIIVLLQFLLNSNGHNTSICNCLEDFLSDIHWYLAIRANKTTQMEMEEVILFSNSGAHCIQSQLRSLHFSSEIPSGIKIVRRVSTNQLFPYDTRMLDGKVRMMQRTTVMKLRSLMLCSMCCILV